MIAKVLPCFATIRVKDIVDENFQDYRKPSMFIGSVACDFKCLRELDMDIGICHNMKISRMPEKYINVENIYDRYISNPLTQAVVVGGLEPFLQFEELYNLIYYFREVDCHDDFVIYTGYYENEIQNQIEKLKRFDNIIIKYGRFIPNSVSKYDKVLGVNLSSENQHAERIS